MHKNISFLELITNYSISIPEIQRDYAQGRSDTKTTEIRSIFLEEIFDTLITENSEPLVLDFVYGSTDEKNSFIPLDGQQRLTTLFLLHWYLSPDSEQLLQKFTYSARISSKDFCTELVKHSLAEIKNNIQAFEKESKDNMPWNLSKGIINEPWFQWSWRKDPTIIGMLTMLDAIDEKLAGQANLSHLWKKLTDDKKIVFHLLPLEKFKLTDELYVKMNARGKELSSFDILKSSLEEQMKKNNISSEKQNKWRTHIDSKWMDLFWNRKAIPFLTDLESNKDETVVREVEIYYLRFLERMMYFHLFLIDDFDKPEQLNKDLFQEGIKSVREFVNKNDIISIFSSLSKCGFFNECFFDFVITTMENILYEENHKITDIGKFVTVEFWNQSVNNLFELFVDEKITYLHRVLFFAQIQFAKYHNAKDVANNEAVKEELNNWMRTIRNLAYNTSYNNIDEFKDTLKALDALFDAVYEKNESKNILEYLVEDGKIARFYGEQIDEEIEKSHQICKDSTWKEKIIEAENYAFFNGSIRFLFTNRNGNYNWELFEERAKKAKLYFDVNGVSKIYRGNNILWRLLICGFTKWEYFWECVYDNSASSWRNILLNKRWIAPLNFLFEEPNPLCFDYIGFEFFHENQSENSALLHYDLVKGDILNCTESGCKLNYRHEQYALYPYNARSKQKIYVIGNKRNKIFSQLVEENKIEIIDNRECGKLEGIPYFWGWILHFKHKNCTYCFNTNDVLQKYDDESDMWKDIKGVSIENIKSHLEGSNQ